MQGSTAIRLNTQPALQKVSGERAQAMIESELRRKTLREEVAALSELRSHIQDLHRICQNREEILLQEMVQGPDLKRLRQLIQLYRASCSSCEPAWDNLQEIRDRALFWFHIGRLRFACELWRLRRMPRLCCSMAVHSLEALNLLTPGVLDVL